MGKLSCPVRESKKYKEKENFTDNNKKKTTTGFSKDDSVCVFDLQNTMISVRHKISNNRE